MSFTFSRNIFSAATVTAHFDARLTLMCSILESSATVCFSIGVNYTLAFKRVIRFTIGIFFSTLVNNPDWLLPFCEYLGVLVLHTYNINADGSRLQKGSSERKIWKSENGKIYKKNEPLPINFRALLFKIVFCTNNKTYYR